jgi:flagellar protein FlaG
MIKDPINSNPVPTVAPRPRVAGTTAGPERKPIAQGGEALPPQDAPKADVIEIGRAVEEINNRMQAVRRDLEFTVDEVSKRTIIRVLDSETKEVIRDIPPETVLAMARMIRLQQDDSIKGLLLEQKA